MSRTGYHEPVLLTEVLERLPAQAVRILDGTLGHGGHAVHIQEKNPDTHIVGVDRDIAMLQKAQARLQEVASQMSYVHGSYADFPKIMETTGGQLFDGMLLDIGVNMEHFKDGDRGFSIKKDGPLDMRFDITTGQTAQERLRQSTPVQFQTMLESFTDFSPKRIQRTTEQFFVTGRDFATTRALYERAKSIKMNEKAMAVFFQAIRITVNGELDEFGSFLKQFPLYLSPGGRCIFLTYHSIEDRMAKQSCQSRADQGEVRILTKHVIQPTRSEKQRNPAARSAKMRVVEKI